MRCESRTNLMRDSRENERDCERASYVTQKASPYAVYESLTRKAKGRNDRGTRATTGSIALRPPLQKAHLKTRKLYPGRYSLISMFQLIPVLRARGLELRLSRTALHDRN